MSTEQKPEYEVGDRGDSELAAHPWLDPETEFGQETRMLVCTNMWQRFDAYCTANPDITGSPQVTDINSCGIDFTFDVYQGCGEYEHRSAFVSWETLFKNLDEQRAQWQAETERKKQEEEARKQREAETRRQAQEAAERRQYESLKAKFG